MILFALGGVIAGFAGEPSFAALPLTGQNIVRPGGGWVNVSVESNQFVISFFNDKLEPVPADEQHGLAQYSPVTLPSRRAALRPSADGKTLVSPLNVLPPHEFRLNLALFNEAPDSLPETYALFYHG
jgi:hypothetical protein